MERDFQGPELSLVFLFFFGLKCCTISCDILFNFFFFEPSREGYTLEPFFVVFLVFLLLFFDFLQAKNEN